MVLITPPTLTQLPCLDSAAMAAARRRELGISRSRAAELGRSALEAVRRGYYVNQAGERVDWRPLVERAQALKRSIPPEAPLPGMPSARRTETRVQVSNETTLQAALRLVVEGHHPLALNFANGVQPGGGFLLGARAQEEVLCRSSALYCTLVDDPLYAFHRRRPRPDSTDWVILSPEVPIFRSDEGQELAKPWLLSVLTSAAPYAPRIGQPESGDLLNRRIQRILAVAAANGYTALVLGAWGCGAFGNDPHRTALDFREALRTTYAGCFTEVVFAVTDWSPERKFLGPFRDVFSLTPARSGDLFQ